MVAAAAGHHRIVEKLIASGFNTSYDDWVCTGFVLNAVYLECL